MPLFTSGEADYGDGIEHVAEDGNPVALGASLPNLSGFLAGDVFNMPVGSDTPGPISPGKQYMFTFQASPGDALSFATTEANEEPALGPNTVTNQLAPDTGAPGEEAVQSLSDVEGDDYPYPAANAVLKVTISAQ